MRCLLLGLNKKRLNDAWTQVPLFIVEPLGAIDLVAYHEVS